jgi:hypothetical protein
MLDPFTTLCFEFTSRMQAMSPPLSETFVLPGPSIVTVPPESLTISTSKPLPKVFTAGTVIVMAAVATSRLESVQ